MIGIIRYFDVVCCKHVLMNVSCALMACCFFILSEVASAQTSEPFPVEACVVTRDEPLTSSSRLRLAHCLGWLESSSLCHGLYRPLNISPIPDKEEVRISADEVSLYFSGRSKLQGHVAVRQTDRVVSAQTAYIYRDEKTHQVTRIDLLGGVTYVEPDRLMIARKATLYPEDKTGKVEDVLYRLKTDRLGVLLPSWGRAQWVKRFANQNYLMRNATYSTCAPQSKAWQIEARSLKISQQKGQGEVRDAVLRLADWPVFYAPYLNFPTTKARKSGFLAPTTGYSNVGGFDLALPYYWNMAPNYDATIVPHIYSLRGLMMGAKMRFLTDNTVGVIGGNFLPNDYAYNKFLHANEQKYSVLQGNSRNRWSVLWHESAALSQQWHMNINYQQVSDDYYLQDFSSNLAILTENQLLREGDITYTSDHWQWRGLVQSYQTLHPITQSAISNIYERLPQLLAKAAYHDLPMHADMNLLGEFDYYRWPANNVLQPQGPRLHLNPMLSFPHLASWGYLTPTVQLVENYYDVHYQQATTSTVFNRTIPRYSVDSGLLFERSVSTLGEAYTQTLEPRLYYLNVPYYDQSSIPVYDSAYMIFNTDQLFRFNRFSGVDRIGDTNQLSYAVTSRWLAENSGRERASVTVGQARYFDNRQVGLCYQAVGPCVDTSAVLGYLSPTAKSSPIASRATYHLNSSWMITSDYVWDVYTHATNNGNVNLHYQPAINHIIRFGYSYLVSGNDLQAINGRQKLAALSQATVAYAWPFTERWSGLGAYSYNISAGYDMMAFLGVQYDNCCWAMRLMGGRAFKSLVPGTFSPQYNNNVYVQVLLKGLGSLGNSDPVSTIRTYLPGYRNAF